VDASKAAASFEAYLARYVNLVEPAAYLDTVGGARLASLGRVEWPTQQAA